MADKNVEEDDKKENGGCFTTIIAVLIVLGLIIGIPSCMEMHEDREREAQRAYEESLPKAPNFEYTKEDVESLLQKNLLWTEIRYSLGDFITTTYTIHRVDCTDIRQIGVRRDTVNVTLTAYTYYIDGKLTFTRTDEYTYNFDTKEWEYFAGEWEPANIEING